MTRQNERLNEKFDLLFVPHPSGSLPAHNRSDELYLTWDVMFGENYNKEKRAIVIPDIGVYFIYVRLTLKCQDEDAMFKRFYVALHKWNEGYNITQLLTDAWDGIVCTPGGLRSVFVGQLFDLLEGDHVMVWIGKGYELIMKSSFGAYLT
uniref:THD domain-containing protein n=1 Tax=Lates calcarifer TaxID=8187 RepID=A0A4W6EK68_LATCA